MKLTFVVPCYNEEKNIKLFYDDVASNFKKSKYDIELIFINDGSKDNTLVELKKLVETTKEYEIKIINFSRNFGKEAGIYAGLEHSTGDYVVLIDADMQQPPRLVIDMLKVIEKNEDIDIVTYYQEKRIEDKVLSFFKSNFYKIINKLTGIQFINGASDFRLLKKDVVKTILTLSEHQRFSKGIFAWIGYNVHYLPYVPEKRANGNTSWSFKSLFRYALSGIFSFVKDPMNLLCYLGMFSVVVSLIWFIILLISKVGNMVNYIYPFIVFMSGINFMVLWYIGIFISRNYEELKNRPIYIAKEVIINEKNN